MDLRLERFGEREHGVADVVVLLSVVWVALVTWCAYADDAGVPAWRPSIGVAVAVLLALAALTRHPRWAASIRFLTGGWLAAAPHVLKFDSNAAVFWSCLAIGVVLMVTASPRIDTRRPWRLRMAV
jgi:hypothetical protein